MSSPFRLSPASSLAALQILFALAAANAGENLLFNSSFELGTRGYSIQCNQPAGKPLQRASEEIDLSCAKFGSKSLLLRSAVNGEEGSVSMLTHDFDVAPGAKYFVSAWVKGEASGTSFFASAQSWQTGGVAKAPDGAFLPESFAMENGVLKGAFLKVLKESAPSSFKAGPEWSRVSFSFVAAPGHSAYCIEIYLQGGTLWLDGLQVEKGELSDYAPAAPVEAAPFVDGLLVDASRVDGKLLAVSYAKSERAFPLALTLRDSYWRENLASKNFALDLPAGELVERSFSFDLRRRGAFALFTSLQPDETPFSLRSDLRVRPECDARRKRLLGDKSYESEALFLSLGWKGAEPQGFWRKLLLRQTPEKDGFALGVNASPDRLRNPFTWESRNFGSLEQVAKVEALAGSVARLHDQQLFSWLENEPEKGKFDWTRADASIAALERAGAAPFAVIGAFEGFHVARGSSGNQGRVPQWVADNDRFGHPEGNEFPELKAACQPGIPKTVLPRLDDWRAYVKAMATRFKGRVKFYEVFNEPYFNFTPKLYVEYLRTAFEAVREADPDAKVVGICATADRGANPSSWLRRCLKEGAGSFCDIVSIHPYDVDRSPVPAMNSLRACKKALADFGVEKPLWNSETYWCEAGTKNSLGGFDAWNQIEFDSAGVARRSAIDMGEGLAGSTSLHLAGLFAAPRNPHQSAALPVLRGTLEPDENLAALNASSLFMDGAKPFKTIELPGGALSYVFLNHDRVFSVQWSLNQACELKFELPSGASFKTFDFFGNETPSNGASVKLDRRPAYLEWEGTDAAGAARTLEKAVVKSSDPLPPGRVVAFERDGKTFAATSFVNLSGSDIAEAELALQSPALTRSPARVKAGGCARMEGRLAEIPLALEAGAAAARKPVPFMLSVASGANESTTRGELVFAESATAGTRPSSPFRATKSVVGRPSSPEDLSASFKVWREGERLVVQVDVKDDVAGKRAAAPYDEDCVELYVDPFPFERGGGPDGDGNLPSTAHFLVDECRNPALRLLPCPWNDEKAEVETKPSADGYQVVFKVPLGSVAGPLAGKSVGLDVAVDDSDDVSRKTQIVWSGSAANWRSRAGFGLLRFSKD